MRRKNKDNRVTVTLLMALVIFVVLVLVLLSEGICLVILLRSGLLPAITSSTLRRPGFILQLLIISLAVASVLTGIASRIMAKPINKLIHALRQLATGDYSTHLEFPAFMNRSAAVRSVTKEFNALADELKNTEMLRGDFVNNFSHEFKTPIVSISGFARLLKRGHLSPEEQQEYLTIIEEESHRLSDMATNVLNLTRIENQEILTEVSDFNVSEQIRDCVLLLENKWSRKNIDLQLEFEEYEVRANEELLKEVWINLLDNAVKFAETGGIVRVSITETPEDLLIAVMNTGSEIPPDKRERIFDKFYQGDESHKTEGSGVGLSVVQKIVDLHQGDVRASSGGGQTIFTVRLPKGFVSV